MAIRMFRFAGAERDDLKTTTGETSAWTPGKSIKHKDRRHECGIKKAGRSKDQTEFLA